MTLDDSSHDRNARRLDESMQKVGPFARRPFGAFLPSEDLAALEGSKERSILSRVMRKHFGALDRRIRFVESDQDGFPAGTMKLFSSAKALEVPAGMRIRELLDGGVVATTVLKLAKPKDWCIMSQHPFLPSEKSVSRHEADIEKLLLLFRSRPEGRFFPSKRIGAFQIRTGPGGYALYLMANEYFRAESH